VRGQPKAQKNKEFLSLAFLVSSFLSVTWRGGSKKRPNVDLDFIPDLLPTPNFISGRGWRPRAREGSITRP
jgi:hypothetical protein